MAHSDILSQPDRGLGLDRPQTEALLALFSRCDDLREFGREVIQSVVNALMDSQAQEACGAPRGSRSPEWIGNTYLDDFGRDSPASLNSTGDM